jgi:hypothetical protein
LRTLFLSLRSFSHTDPLFSITSRLFLQNTGGGVPEWLYGTPGVGVSPHVRATLCSEVTCTTWRLYPLCPQSIAHTSCHHGGVGSAIFARRLPFATRHFPTALCFHILTNCFPRNPFSFHINANPRGCGSIRHCPRQPTHGWWPLH